MICPLIGAVTLVSVRPSKVLVAEELITPLLIVIVVPSTLTAPTSDAVAVGKRYGVNVNTPVVALYERAFVPAELVVTEISPRPAPTSLVGVEAYTIRTPPKVAGSKSDPSELVHFVVNPVVVLLNTSIL